MAETVGLIASIATLAEVALKLEQMISRLRNAPDELLALSNELTDIKVLFKEVERSVEDDPESKMRFQGTLDIANHRIHAVGAFLGRLDISNVNYVDRVTWLRYKSKVCRLQSQIRDARIHLTALLGVETMYVFLMMKCH